MSGPTPCILCVTARFLAGTYHGRGRDGEPEWPPSPLRLFQALVAAAGDRRTPAEADALRWLERRPAPEIAAAAYTAVGAPRQVFVPNNDADRQTDHAANRALKVFRPLHLPDGAEVQYRWPVDAADRGAAQGVARLAGRLRALGWGIDVVAGRGALAAAGADQTDEGDVELWRPVKGEWVGEIIGGPSLRVPDGGTLESLERIHAAKQGAFAGGSFTPTDRDVHGPARAYRPAAGPPPRPVVAFSLVGADGQPAPAWPATACHVAARVRHAARDAAILAGWPDADVRGYVCGHFPDAAPDPIREERLSYLPLPSIGHAHTDGLIRRVLVTGPIVGPIVGPVGGDGGRLENLARRLVGRPLTAETFEGEPTCPPSASAPCPPAVLVPCPPLDKVLLRYCGASRHWATVTPVVMPGHHTRGSRSKGSNGRDAGDPFELSRDDLLGGGRTGLARKAAKLAVALLASAGLAPELVTRLTLTAVPPFPNLPHAGRYVVPQNLCRLPRTHVRLTFATRVAGPLAMGAGRFRGLGTLAPTGG